MKKFLYILIFLLSGFFLTLCLTQYVFCFYYSEKKGDKNYYESVKENVLIFNFGRNVKKINYCFTNENSCDNYVSYDTDLSKGVLKIVIDYPDSLDEERICVNVVSSKSNSVKCKKKGFIVDSTNPVVTSLYDEIILGDNDNLESLYKVEAKTGVKDFKCNLTKDMIKCKATGNNGLETNFEQKVYNSNVNPLENKKVLFSGDSITKAEQKRYDGWAGRVGIGNYMDWINVGVNGSTIAFSNKHILDQITSRKDEDFDYIILQGGINDVHKGIELGEMSSSFKVEDFDNTNYAGGLEELFYYTKEYNPSSKIGFIITYQTPNSSWGDSVTDRSEQAKLTRAICDKWDIPYLDLYDGKVYEKGNISSFADLLDVKTGKNLLNKDPKQVHLSNDGYDIISKYISVWMKTL